MSFTRWKPTTRTGKNEEEEKKKQEKRRRNKLNKNAITLFYSEQISGMKL